MTEAQATTAPPVHRAPVSSQQAVHSVIATARQVVKPSLQAGVITVAAAVLFWGICFGPSLFVSFRTFSVCTFVLLLALLPGGVLCWLHHAIRLLSRLPLPDGAPPQPLPELAEDPEARPTFVRELWKRVLPFLALRTHLLAAEDEIAKVAGMRRTVTILAHAVTAVVVPVAAGLGVLLSVGACLAIVVAIFRAIF